MKGQSTHSTRVKYKLPKYVHYFKTKNGGRKPIIGHQLYRVVKKDKNSGYITIGYFKTLDEARICAEFIEEMNQ